jgi:hypothetical protein
VVGQTLPHVIGVVLRLADERGNVLIVNRVEHGRTVPPASYHTAIAQEAELVRDA